ncbi:MAG: hypothetical protein AAGF90_13680, partial [Pseudomonadota bacterium]
VVAFALTLIAVVDRIDAAGRVALALLAAFAVMTHYGNIALAAGLIGAALLMRGALGGLSWRLAAFAVAPLALALAANALVGAVATGKAGVTVAPLRPPILLARSIEDGPARWHLEEACPEAGYAVCEVFADGVPDNVNAALWGPGGLAHAGRATLDRIRAEEPLILARAFAEHPAAQTWSFAGNAVRQFFRIGVSRLTKGVDRWVNWMLLASYVAAVVVLALVAVLCRRRAPEASALAALTLLALVLNAAVFGGLSTPADRYQGRIAWMAPMMALILLARADIRAFLFSAAAKSDAPGGVRMESER